MCKAKLGSKSWRRQASGRPPSSAGVKGGDKLRSLQRPFHPDVQFPRSSCPRSASGWGRSPSSSESKISPSSESSAARAGESGWPTAAGARKGSPSIDAGTSIADRLKRAAQPNSDASEEDGCFESWKLGLTVDAWG